QPMEGVEARLGEGSEIQLRGPNIMTGGYLNKPDKTAESFTPDGWYRTGDTGKIVSIPVHNPWKVGGWSGVAGAVVGGLVGSFVGMPVVGAVAGATALAGLGALVASRVKDDFYAITGRIKSQFKLPGGEYVAPEPIEESLRGSQFIQEAVVVGSTTKDIVGALIVPKFDNLKAWAASKGLPTEPAEMVKHPDVIKMMREEAGQRSAGHAEHERVRAVALLPREFTLESDELTPSFKVKRPVVLQRYADDIKGMFQAGTAPAPRAAAASTPSSVDRVKQSEGRQGSNYARAEFLRSWHRCEEELKWVSHPVEGMPGTERVQVSIPQRDGKTTVLQWLVDAKSVRAENEATRQFEAMYDAGGS
ncbi:MAG: hypothetical protein AB1758_28300, partial [Candidatus Eremiobacterota bacterium]